MDFILRFLVIDILFFLADPPWTDIGTSGSFKWNEMHFLFSV